ncbi:HD-GYP domain-containing protein [Paenibacillus eucommiae]|uniref:Nucleotidyltransferase with HDIG domain n=1 Tax=Paenibacillus eucommiae TaxID=1355755 RepID=A0ABS4IQ19_9BACL|nr:HD-GYP domain-containing protein [Paenibacillus eucommiae]MBP1989006.1 putative nucleotidyltransferase with HDIG domain [Paenibacillus eucommiae]
MKNNFMCLSSIFANLNDGGGKAPMHSGLMEMEMGLLLAKDKGTYKHSLRLASIADALGSHLKFDNVQREKLVAGCLLHDLGKTGIPDEILGKSSSLTVQEWEVMKQHPTIGVEMLMKNKHVDKEIINIVEFHHERWSGGGYPKGLRGNEIPVFARICAIIDAYDCMISERPYHKGLSKSEAKEQLVLHSGTQFDPFYVQEFILLLERS